MDKKDKSNNVQTPQPVEKGFGKEPIHDKPTSSGSDKKINQDYGKK